MAQVRPVSTDPWLHAPSRAPEPLEAPTAACPTSSCTFWTRCLQPAPRVLCTTTTRTCPVLHTVPNACRHRRASCSQNPLARTATHTAAHCRSKASPADHLPSCRLSLTHGTPATTSPLHTVRGLYQTPYAFTPPVVISPRTLLHPCGCARLAPLPPRPARGG